MNEAQKFGRKYWGEIGQQIFRKFEQYTKSNTHFILAAPQGFGKTTMLREFYENFHKKEVQFITDTTSAKFFGTITKEGEIVVPTVLLKHITVLPDFSSMLVQKITINDFCGKLNQLIDGKINTNKCKLHQKLTQEAEKIKRDFSIVIKDGQFKYLYDGLLIVCILPDFIKEVRADTCDRFKILYYNKDDCLKIFNHILQNGFLPKSGLPRIDTKFHKLIKNVFPRELKTPRQLALFMKQVKFSMEENQRSNIEEEDIHFGIEDLYATNKYGNLSKDILYNLKKFIDDDEGVANILGLNPDTVKCFRYIGGQR